MTSLALSRLPALCFATQDPAARWVQFDIALVRADCSARASAQRLFARFMPWWQAQSAAGHVGLWFFMRKPPDVRLRFLATQAAGDAVAGLTLSLEQAQACGEIASVACGEYCAEVARFGGPAAMAAVHALFTLDSVLWHGREQLAQDGRVTLADEDWLGAIFADMFEAVCGDAASAAWRALAALTVPHARALPDAPWRPPSLAGLCESEAIDPGERMQARAWREGNARFSRALHDLSSPASCSVADIAATSAFFTFNRHGFPGARSGPLLAAITLGLDPARSR